MKSKRSLKVVVYTDDGPPIAVEGKRVQLTYGEDMFEIRPNGSNSILVRIEEHGGHLALDLAVFPNGGNSVRLKGGLQ